MTQSRKRWEDLITIAFLVSAIAGPILIVFGQCFYWLHNAIWFPLSLRYITEYNGFSVPTTTWAGLNIIISGFFDLPLAMSVFFCGVALAFTSMRLFKD